jgi:hypothetical protein
LHNDVGCNSVAIVSAVVDGGDASSVQLAVDLGSVIDKKPERHEVLAFLHVNGDEASPMAEFLPETDPLCIAGP